MPWLLPTYTYIPYTVGSRNSEQNKSYLLGIPTVSTVSIFKPAFGLNHASIVWQKFTAVTTYACNSHNISVRMLWRNIVLVVIVHIVFHISECEFHIISFMVGFSNASPIPIFLWITIVDSKAITLFAKQLHTIISYFQFTLKRMVIQRKKDVDP